MSGTQGYENVCFVTGEIETNTYILYSSSKTGIIIDPAGNNPKKINDFIEKENISLAAVVLTHGHYDHIGLADFYSEKFNIPIYIHPDDEPMLKMAELNFSVYMNNPLVIKSKKIERLLDGELVIGDIELEIVATPGHTKGSVCVIAENMLFSGDTLFYRSVGRTDLAGGSSKVLQKSLAKLIKKCPDSMEVFPGHGISTVIIDEKENNFFLGEKL